MMMSWKLAAISSRKQWRWACIAHSHTHCDNAIKMLCYCVVSVVVGHTIFIHCKNDTFYFFLVIHWYQAVANYVRWLFQTQNCDFTKLKVQESYDLSGKSIVNFEQQRFFKNKCLKIHIILHHFYGMLWDCRIVFSFCYELLAAVVSRLDSLRPPPSQNTHWAKIKPPQGG